MLTDKQLNNRKHYYQGYGQCLTDIINILKQTYQEQDENNRLYLNMDNVRLLEDSLMKRILDTYEWGYMYYDEKQEKFVYIEEEFEEDNE